MGNRRLALFFRLFIEEGNTDSAAFSWVGSGVPRGVAFYAEPQATPDLSPADATGLRIVVG